MPRAVILTAIPVEYQAVRTYLTGLQPNKHPRGRHYEQGTFSANGQVWDVKIAAIGPGNIGAALQTQLAIAYFNPDVILFVGVAGGIKDVRLGDVVAATKVYGYESGKAEESFKSRANFGRSTSKLEKIARSEANINDWLERLPLIPEPTPTVFVAPIVSGEKVVASTKSEVFQFLRSRFGDAVAVEMEGIGFLDAAHDNPQVSAMVIRGISDLIDGKSEVDAQGYQEIAAHHASAFAFQVLAKFIVENDNKVEGVDSRVRPKAERDLLKTVKQRAYSRLHGQLHHQVKLNLTQQTQPQQVRPWSMEVKVAIAKPSQRLPPDTTIGQVFDQCFGRLLILGEP
ncbi:MAG: 5'-methylthioadenosine/S-adenosylhomocysteine nucleosidase, partial [Symploca sp. SIO2E6]|nr:5'-methylthioadenosine/S-adenosylhomocysteine nucleosidase [Symploca sp. SIO2E6]